MLVKYKLDLALISVCALFALCSGYQMRSIQPYIALTLLFLFCRTLAPEAAVLAMHQHEHTEDARPASDSKVSTKHVHCHVDDLYNSDFTSPAFSFELKLNPVEVCYVQPYSFAWKFTYPNNTYLRGPPTA